METMSFGDLASIAFLVALVVGVAVGTLCHALGYAQGRIIEMIKQLEPEEKED